MTFQETHQLTNYINQYTVAAKRGINLMKAVSTPEWGGVANAKAMLTLYYAFVMWKLLNAPGLLLTLNSTQLTKLSDHNFKNSVRSTAINIKYQHNSK